MRPAIPDLSGNVKMTTSRISVIRNIESGKNIAAGDVADYVLPENNQDSQLKWYTLEFTFLNHAPINKYVSIRYGGGAGIGTALAVTAGIAALGMALLFRATGTAYRAHSQSHARAQ